MASGTGFKEHLIFTDYWLQRTRQGSQLHSETQHITEGASPFLVCLVSCCTRRRSPASWVFDVRPRRGQGYENHHTQVDDGRQSQEANVRAVPCRFFLQSIITSQLQSRFKRSFAFCGWPYVRCW